ncbi:MAG: 50S ribosomal protein L30 [Spirochaetes bacterium]|nr:50S ribosomal protein L30 [Spirochaetota bacterium]
MAKIQITLVRSTIHQKPVMRATIRSLGLRKICSTTVKEATPAVLGMVNTVKHLVSTQEVSAQGAVAKEVE